MALLSKQTIVTVATLLGDEFGDRSGCLHTACRARHWTLRRARDLATSDGAASVEAEHVLLALTQQADEPTARALNALGMTETAVRAALDDEFVGTLQSVGVAATVPPQRAPRPGRSAPKLGQSAKLAVVRSLQVALERGHRRIDDHHILLALSQAEAGVIPRVLRALDVNLIRIDDALR